MRRLCLIFFLVPKLQLGDISPRSSHFARLNVWLPKQSFGDKGIAKLELGNDANVRVPRAARPSVYGWHGRLVHPLMRVGVPNDSKFKSRQRTESPSPYAPRPGGFDMLISRIF